MSGGAGGLVRGAWSLLKRFNGLSGDWADGDLRVDEQFWSSCLRLLSEAGGAGPE